MGGSLLDAVVFRVGYEIRDLSGDIPPGMRVPWRGRPPHGGGE